MKLSGYIENLENFIKMQEIPNEVFEILSEKTKAVYNLCEAKRFFAVIENYEKTGAFDMDEVISAVKEITKKTGEDTAFYYMILAILLSFPLKEIYERKGFSEELWFNTVAEIKRKADECKKSYGIWGVGLGFWYKGIFELRWFSFARLNFEIFESPYDYCKSGASVKKGDLVLSVHIPSGSPLVYEKCLEGYNQAAKFFKERFNINPVFYCYSWLVFPGNKNVLKEGSNILRFAADYDIIDQEIIKDGCDFGRIFGKNYSGNLNDLPTNTTLQRNIVEYLKSGKKLGCGRGFFVYNG